MVALQRGAQTLIHNTDSNDNSRGRRLLSIGSRDETINCRSYRLGTSLDDEPDKAGSLDKMQAKLETARQFILQS